jgi:hypothetical protein
VSRIMNSASGAGALPMGVSGAVVGDTLWRCGAFDN